MIEDFTTTIKAQLYERVSSPLLSSFFVSWCCWNYKFILIVISGISVMEKLVFIDLNIFPNVRSVIVQGVALPLVTSLLLIFVYPKPAEFIYRHVKLNQRRLKEIQQSIDDESPISKEQARKIRRESLENQLKYEAELDSKTSENVRLKELIAELQMASNKGVEFPGSHGHGAGEIAMESYDVETEKNEPAESKGNYSYSGWENDLARRKNKILNDLASSVSSFYPTTSARSVSEMPLSENDKYISSFIALIKKLISSGESESAIRDQLLGVGVSEQIVSRILSESNAENR